MSKPRRIEDTGKTDIEKKRAIPTQGRFADAHERYLKQRGKCNEPKRTREKN